MMIHVMHIKSLIYLVQFLKMGFQKSVLHILYYESKSIFVMLYKDLVMI